MPAGDALGARTTQDDNLRRKAAHITKLLRIRPGDATAAVNEFIEACSALPPGQTASDLASALGRSICRQLEQTALQSFQQQLHPRSRRTRPEGATSHAARVTRVPRALAELQSAAKAWRLSPLVLLAEFVHAPKSDNFWRLLARLARSHRHGSWPEVRERLHAARHRRRYDLLARRQGVSHVQPWAIPDIMAVLKEQESEPEEEQEEAEENDDAEEQEQEQDQEQEQEQEQEKAHIHQHQDEAYDEVPARPTMQISAPDGNATALPVPKQPSSDGENGNSGENGGGKEIGNPLPNTIYVRGSEQSSVWHFAYGWWLPANIVNRLCSSLAQIQPEQFKFTASKNGISPLPTDVTTDTLPPRIYQPDGTTRTIIAPLRIKASNHWILATLCPSEMVISVYNPLPNSSLSHAEVTAALDGVLVNVLSEDDAFAVADCAVVPRSCPAQTSSIDSGVAVIALSLYCLVGRSIPQHTNSWLWRRMLAFYLTRLSPGDPAQTAKDSAMATLFAMTLSGHQVDAPADATTSAATAAADSATRTETEKNTTNRIQPQPFVEHSALAQRDSVIEGRAVWMAAAQLASRAEADARRKRDDIVNEMKNVVDALFHHELESETGVYPRRGDARTSLEGDGSTLAKSVRRLEMAVKKAEAEMAGIAVVVNGIHAVLKDLDTIIPITKSNYQN